MGIIYIIYSSTVSGYLEIFGRKFLSKAVGIWRQPMYRVVFTRGAVRQLSNGRRKNVMS